MKTKNLSRISFPALGAGGFGFPSKLVAINMIEFITKFLVLSENCLNVNIVLHVNDKELITVTYNSTFKIDKI